MIHSTVTQSVGKRVVGKQNILPLIRDIAEDDRVVKVSIDTEKNRYTGEVLSMRTSTDEAVLLKTNSVIPARVRIAVTTKRILALVVLEVGPAPNSPVGEAHPELLKNANEN